jgi:hypothetical protein
MLCLQAFLLILDTPTLFRLDIETSSRDDNIYGGKSSKSHAQHLLRPRHNHLILKAGGGLILHLKTDGSQTPPHFRMRGLRKNKFRRMACSNVRASTPHAPLHRFGESLTFRPLY